MILRMNYWDVNHRRLLALVLLTLKILCGILQSITNNLAGRSNALWVILVRALHLNISTRFIKEWRMHQLSCTLKIDLLAIWLFDLSFRLSIGHIVKWLFVGIMRGFRIISWNCRVTAALMFQPTLIRSSALRIHTVKRMRVEQLSLWLRHIRPRT